MACVTSAQVKELFANVPATVDLTPWITMASFIVDDVAVAGPTLGATRLLEIERNLAAHFYSEALQPRPMASTSRARSQTYASKDPPHLAAAKALDPTGVVATATMERKKQVGLKMASSNPRSARSLRQYDL